MPNTHTQLLSWQSLVTFTPQPCYPLDDDLMLHLFANQWSCQWGNCFFASIPLASLTPSLCETGKVGLAHISIWRSALFHPYGVSKHSCTLMHWLLRHVSAGLVSQYCPRCVCVCVCFQNICSFIEFYINCFPLTHLGKCNVHSLEGRCTSTNRHMGVHMCTQRQRQRIL